MLMQELVSRKLPSPSDYAGFKGGSRWVAYPDIPTFN